MATQTSPVEVSTTTGNRPMDREARSAAVIERVCALLPALRERAARAGELRCIPEQTIADFHQAGLFRMLQPARWGGEEADPGAFFEVQIAVATACPSSAWVLGVIGVHNWQLALFPLEAQEEVWGSDPTTFFSNYKAPT